MVFMRLDDVTGGAEVVVFASVYAQSRELIAEDRILVVKGRVDHKEGESKVLALEVASFEAVAEKREVRLRIDARIAKPGTIRELAAVIRDFPGESPVYLDCLTSQGRKTYAFGPRYRVRPVPDFYAEVRMLLGESAAS
jgi:DNA polymerase-3 subunit alpha